MKLITKRLLLCLMLCLSLSQTALTNETGASSEGADAGTNEEQLIPSKDFTYEGQSSETFQLSNSKTETRYREEQVPSTCTREVPYTENVCSDETFYRQECTDVPGYENCYDVTEQECHTVPRTRQQCDTSPGHNVCRPGPSREECHRTPSRQVCRRGPSRQVCRTVDDRVCRTVPGREICRVNRRTGENVCRTLPSREVCEGKPRQVCRDVPGEETCRTVGGDRVCRTVQGDDICRWIPGETTCRDVTENEQVCNDVTRNQCDWVPPSQSCVDIPYTQNVCRDVTRTRTETYDCMETIQVPYTVTLKKYFAELNFEEFRSLNAGAKAAFTASLSDEGKIKVKAKDESEVASLIFAKQKVVPVDETEQDLHLKAFFKVNFVEKSKLLAPLTTELSNLELKKTEFNFDMGLVSHPKALSLKLKIERGDDVFIDRVLKKEEFTMKDKEQMTAIHIDLKKLGLKKLKKKDHKVTLEIGVKPAGIILNEEAPEFTKTHELKLKPKGGWFSK